MHVRTKKGDVCAICEFHAIEIQGSDLVELVVQVTRECEGSGEDNIIAAAWEEATFMADSFAQPTTKRSELSVRLILLETTS